MNASVCPPSFVAPAEAGRWLRQVLPGHAELRVDSREIVRGDGFLAMPGLTVDGRRFIDDALRRGASAVLSEHLPDDTAIESDDASPPRKSLAGLAKSCGDVAASFYGDPSEVLEVVAVTGTNGKTSCANWIASGNAADGADAAAIGTLGVRRYHQSALVDAGAAGIPALTTPDAVSMQRVLAALVRGGCASVALEASSIGLDQNRLGGVRIDAAIFTNLSRDHLDYHGSINAYAQAKARLFARPELRLAVVNGDDPAAGQMLAATGPNTRTIAYGFEPGRYGAGADQQVRIERFESRANDVVLHLDGDLGCVSVPVSLMGRFNAANAAAVWATWRGLGVDLAASCERLAALKPVPGRMQAIRVDGAPLAIIDYAHTPDALQSALQALADQARARNGRIWCVFGCGGDRDAGKRPLMAAAAESAADRLVLTSDNPRSEPAERILEQMLAGLKRPPHAVIADRAQAIAAAISQAAPADVVLVAGKGHEATQDIAGIKHPFLDEEQVRIALAARINRGVADTGGGHV